MDQYRRLAALGLTLALALSALRPPASAKTNPDGQTVGTVLFYLKNQEGEEILASQIPVSEMEADMQAGRISTVNYNYSILDRYVTTVHQEAQGFTVPEFVAYAQAKSGSDAVRKLSLTYTGQDTIRFWEIDDAGGDTDERERYIYDQLYGTVRYNFPLLYQYWDYRMQDYCDPAGRMSRDEVIDHIFESGEQVPFLLSVRAFSQRYMNTEGKYGSGDYNMEGLWQNEGRMDNERTLRIMVGMTKEDLYQKRPTASDTRYWVWNLCLDMASRPAVRREGTVEAPTAVMTEDETYYYIRFSCPTGGANIYYNHNVISPSYMPTALYTGSAVKVEKKWFPNGVVTMTAHAVRDGWTDAGVVTLELRSSGTEQVWENPFTDVTESDWCYDAVAYAAEQGLFSGVGGGRFAPEGTMTRAMFASVFHRYAGSPEAPGTASFTDVPAGEWYSESVNWAAAEGVLSGTGGGYFSPGGEITLEQMAAVLCRYAGGTAEGEAPGGYGPVSGWAAGAMEWARSAGLFEGVGGTLRAQAPATRAQVAAIMMRFAGLPGQ